MRDFPGLTFAGPRAAQEFPKASMLRHPQERQGLDGGFAETADAGNGPRDAGTARREPVPPLPDLAHANSAVLRELETQISQLEVVRDNLFGPAVMAIETGKISSPDDTLAAGLWRQNTILLSLTERLGRVVTKLQQAH